LNDGIIRCIQSLGGESIDTNQRIPMDNFGPSRPIAR
jgi:hypothetical protein